ncbi:DedA family protein [Modestobacter versicolor]|uniref:DedA family protein n=1 Tax=Modestobacter versicolor TaxID=429133 RepID=UPI0034DF08A5
MVNAVLDAVGSWPAGLVLAVAAVVLALESGVVLGVVLPGSTLLVALGVWSAASDTPAAVPFAVAASASVLGALAGWRRGHDRRAPSGGHGLLRARVDPAVRRAREWLATQGPVGAAAVLAVGHWAAVTRTLVPRVAGGAGVPFAVAAPVLAVSGTAWATTVVLLARALGQQVADDASWAPAVVLGVVGAALLVRHWRHAHAAHTG